MPHLESVEIARLYIPHPHVFDRGRRRALAHPLDDLLDRCGVALDMRVDPPVGTVADPTGHSDFGGLFAQPRPEKHALHAPRHGDVPGNHHTVAMSGASSAFMPTTL